MAAWKVTFPETYQRLGNGVIFKSLSHLNFREVLQPHTKHVRRVQRYFHGVRSQPRAYDHTETQIDTHNSCAIHISNWTSICYSRGAVYGATIIYKDPKRTDAKRLVSRPTYTWHTPFSTASTESISLRLSRATLSVPRGARQSK